MIDNFGLIVGAMKCGTTSLFGYLEEHPQVASCQPKEPNFFADDTNWSRGFEWYQNLWNFNPKIHRIAIDGSTHYTKIPQSPNAAERVATIDAKFKFIYIMRNPFDRIESHYIHGHQVGWLKSDLSKGVDPSAVNICRYAMQIREYYKRFPAEDILLLNFDELKQNPQRLMKKVCDFLDIDPDYSFQRIGQALNSRRTNQAKKKMDYALIQPFKPATKFLPQKFRSAVSQRLGRHSKFVFKLNPEQKNSILLELEDDLVSLRSDYGFDISSWALDI